jgi:signal transduction histidine kinase
VQEKDRAGVIERHRRRLAGEEVPSTYRIELLAKDGHVVPCETSAARITFEGEPADLVLMRDITERVEQEAARRRWEAHLLQAQKLESLGVLAGGIAHDFNNLLVAMLGNAGLALTEVEPESRAAECMRDVEAAAVRAAELVRQLLAYAGKGPFAVERVHLRSVVEEMTHLLETSISKKATLKFVYDASVPTVQADATQLRQVAMNLITNASEALGNEPGTITVEIRSVICDERCAEDVIGGGCVPAGTYASLEVSDTGCGMDEETRTRIFDPFFTTKFAGRGLGLAAALGIVRRHGGAVRVSSAPGEGTRFRVLLPSSSSVVAPAEADSPAPTSFRGSGTILVVDDELAVRTVAERILGRLGFRVVPAVNGREATEIFRQDPGQFVLVLLDLTMPEMGGEETLLALREYRPDIPVLLTSGYGEQELEDRIPRRERVAFIQKPFQLDELAQKLRSMLA